MAYVPKQQRMVIEALTQDSEIKRAKQPELTEEEIQQRKQQDTKQLYDDLKNFTLSTQQKPVTHSEISEKAKISQQTSYTRQIKYVPLSEQRQKQAIKLLYAKYESLTASIETEQIHVVRQLFNEFHSQTVSTGFVATEEYSSCIMDSIKRFVAYLIANLRISILCQVLDEVKGFYYQKYSQIQHEVLASVLEMLVEQIPELPQGYHCGIQDNILQSALKVVAAHPSDNRFVFIMRMMHFLQDSAATCYYPDVFCDIVAKLMLFCVAFQRSAELKIVIGEAQRFSWSPLHYDDYSSIVVQKAVYTLRCDMFCALISLRMFRECYQLLHETALMVRCDLRNEVVTIESIHAELLEILKLTIKYYYLQRSGLFQAQAMYSYLRVALAFNKMDDFQSYANEALVLISSLPHVANEALRPSFVLRADDSFCLNEKVLQITYDDVADELCPFVDAYNMYSVSGGSRSKISAAVRALSNPPTVLLDFLSKYLAFPRYEQNPMQFIASAKDCLDQLALEKFHRDIVTYADLVSIKIIENAIVLFMSRAISAGDELTIDGLCAFCEEVFAKFYHSDRRMLPCFQTRQQLVFATVKLLQFECFHGTRLNLADMRFVVQKMQVLQPEEELRAYERKLLDLTATGAPELSKFNKSVLYDRFYRLIPATERYSIDLQQQCAQIIERRYKLRDESARRAALQQEQQEQFEKQQRATEAQLALQAQERQREQQLRSIIQQIIQQYIIDTTAETDDQEMADYLNSIDLSYVPILKQHREICARQQEFQRKRLQRKQDELAQIAQQIEAQLWHFRSARKAQRAAEFAQKSADLNKMLQALVPARYEAEQQAYNNINKLRDQLAEIGDYAEFIAAAERHADEHLAQRQAEYDATLKRVADEIKQRHADEIEHIAKLTVLRDEELARQFMEIKITSEQAIHRDQMAKQAAQDKKPAQETAKTGAYRPVGHAAPAARAAQTVQAPFGSRQTQPRPTATTANSKQERPRFTNSNLGQQPPQQQERPQPTQTQPAQKPANAAAQPAPGAYVPPSARK